MFKLTEILEISVPASYNELYTNESIRHHVGWVWYNRQFYLNDLIRGSVVNGQNTVVLRLASCHYFCIVWLNGNLLGNHESGHLPFEFDISKVLLSEKTTDYFNLVVAVNNTLSLHTIPPAG